MSAPCPTSTRGVLLTLIVVTFGMGYFLSYFLRNVNAVISPLIVAEFEMSATMIGLLTSLYFLAAALILVPVAVLLDKFGPKRLLIAEMLVTAAGAAVSASAISVDGMLLGRVLIGFGVAGCLTTAFKAVTVWFPRERWATGNSLVLGVGSLGVIAGTEPLRWLVGLTGWRDIFWIVCAASLGVALLAVLLLPERNAPHSISAPGGVYRAVLRMGTVWRIAPIASLSLAGFFAIQGLWANAWMTDVAGLSQDQIGLRLLVMAVATSLGMLINGTLADWLTKAGVPLAAVMSVGLAGLMVAQLSLALALAPQSWWPWALMGFTGNIGALGYPLISRRFAAGESARAMSVLAVSNFLLAFSMQFALGWILDLWGAEANGTYPFIAYKVGFCIMIGLQALAFAWFLTSRDVWATAQERELIL